VFSGCRARTPTTLGADTVEIMVGSDGWVRERAAMTEPYLTLPRVLLVDDDAGRVEYFENLLFRHGYGAHMTSIAGLKAIGREHKYSLVLTFVSLEPEQMETLGAPVLVMTADETPAREDHDASGPRVQHLAQSASPDELFEAMADLRARSVAEDQEE
jgi:hypothetical protein